LRTYCRISLSMSSIDLVQVVLKDKYVSIQKIT